MRVFVIDTATLTDAFRRDPEVARPLLASVGRRVRDLADRARLEAEATVGP